MSVKERESGVDQRLIKALGHPLRQRLLQALNERTASPSELADALGEPLGNVSYHVKILLDCEAIELVRTAPVRGALEHFYQATSPTQLSGDNWDQLPLSVRRSLFDQTLQQIWTHIANAAAEDQLDDKRTHISWTSLELDERGYDELAEHLDNTIERAMEIFTQSLVRLAKLPETEQEKLRTEMVLMHFNRASGGRTKPGTRRRR